MQAHEHRIVTEKRELDERHARLVKFIDDHIYPTLHETDRILLIQQVDVMKEYSNLLGQRIARFTA